MTKSAQIMELYAQGLSTREIADKVGCLDSYVRVVARQRKGGSYSESDRKYVSNYIATGDKDLANKVRRSAYAKARDSGASIDAAKNVAGCAYRKVLRLTSKGQVEHVS
jgi:transposase